jgi:hypothetical protein
MTNYSWGILCDGLEPINPFSSDWSISIFLQM